jgi:hypothetical protein
MRIVWGFVLGLALVCGGARLAATDAHAAGPTTVTFKGTGAVQTFTVPAGVTSITVVATGAPGGAAGALSNGLGGVAKADVAVTPGQVLNVYVGGVGKSPIIAGEDASGGFNGGGTGNTNGAGGGGGASDIRTGGPADLGSRLVVAAGGGGGGKSGRGGNVGEAGGSSSSCSGGGAATEFEGGAGGGGATTTGKKGELGKGGSSPAGGGGGGGGFWGGGSGGANNEGVNPGSTFCGGGAGSNGFGPGTSARSAGPAQTEEPSVVITFTAPPATPLPTPAPAPSPAPAPPGPDGGKDGVGKATVSLPAGQRGKAVVGSVQIDTARSSLKAKLLWQKSKKKRLVFGSLNEGALKKGLHSFTVRLNGAGKAKLEKLGSLKLTLQVAVIPPQGAVAKATRSVTLKP